MTTTDTDAKTARTSATDGNEQLLMLLRRGTGRTAARLLWRSAGIRSGAAQDYGGVHAGPGLRPGEALLLPALELVVLSADAQQRAALVAQGLRIEPGRRVQPRSLQPPLGGYSATEDGSEWTDTEAAAWGLQVTAVLGSCFTGQGIRLAIVDSGLDLDHPDFADRDVVLQSFVPGAADVDGNGHGTFCAGVACGPRRPADGPRYGVACDAQLHVAQALDERASGTDGAILAGIDWAVRHKCAVISLSIGSAVTEADPYPALYEEIAARALEAGSLLVAPAGNQSQRPDVVAPVDYPANCPSVVAVGAVDKRLRVAAFSNGAVGSAAGRIDLVAPGIAILSAAPGATPYQTASGTSMAAPFVAGIAALVAEADPAARGAALRSRLLATARQLSAPGCDVGSGLVRAYS